MIYRSFFLATYACRDINFACRKNVSPSPDAKSWGVFFAYICSTYQHYNLQIRKFCLWMRGHWRPQHLTRPTKTRLWCGQYVTLMRIFSAMGLLSSNQNVSKNLESANSISFLFKTYFLRNWDSYTPTVSYSCVMRQFFEYKIAISAKNNC